MGRLTKQYLRYSQEGIFGVVASKICNAAYLNIQGKPCRFIVTGGTNIINVLDARFQKKVRTLNCDSAAVVLEPNYLGDKLAVGHENGSVSIYDLSDLSEEASPEPIVTFEGHRSEVTCIAWDKSGTQIASGSKDTKVILWDVISETGVHKYTGHSKPITRVRFWKDDRYIVTGSLDTTIRIWDTTIHHNVHTIPGSIQIRDFEIFEDKIIIAEQNLRLLRLSCTDPLNWDTEEIGSILRRSHDRPSRLQIVDGTGILLVIGRKSRVVEVFRLNSEEEVTKRKAKRLRKNPNADKDVILQDIVRRSEPLKASEESIKSISAFCDKGVVKIVCCLPSNQLEVLTVAVKEVSAKADSATSTSDFLKFDGHRKPVRGIAFSSDKTAILTASEDCFKLWNRSTMSCILTIPHEYRVMCCSFCPGDRHFVAGSADGFLIMGDVSTGTITQVESSGNENVLSIDVLDDDRGFAACNGTFIQLYTFYLGDGKLQFELKRQLDVQEPIVCVRVSRDMKYIAASLMDNTIKVFYLDTFKLHVTMYGHSQPAISIGISHDNNLLVSCSGDKTVRVWGMDFGDCHGKMLHTEGLIGCAFLDKSHLIASVAKNTVNIYDGDTRERVQTVKAHVGAGSLCMAAKSYFVASAGRDQTIRLFIRTQEILELGDEREEERREELDNEDKKEEADLTTLQTAEGLKWADEVITALDIYLDPNASDKAAYLQQFETKDSKELLYKRLNMIKAAELQQSLKLLPVEYVKNLTSGLLAILQEYPLSTELVVRCICALMKFHEGTFRSISHEILKPLHDLVTKRVEDLKSLVGINQAGLAFLYDEAKKRDEEQTIKEILGERKRKRKKKEKALKIKRALLTI